LFRFLIRFAPLNKSLVTHIVKWASKNQRDNILLYIIENFALYDVDAEYIFKMCLYHKNYFVLHSPLYKNRRWASNVVKAVIKDVMRDFHAFQIVYKDYVAADPESYNVTELFDDCLDSGLYQSCFLVFDSLSGIEKYKVLKEILTSSFSVYGNDAFYGILLRDSPVYRTSIAFSYETGTFVYHNILHTLLAENRKNTLFLLLGINNAIPFEDPDMAVDTTCFICLEETPDIKSACGHMYCLACFVEYVIDYDNTNCAMCRRKIDLKRLSVRHSCEVPTCAYLPVK
jgi:hypothetical protein